MTVYVCKSCGRAVRAEEKPNFCYADRMDSIENISDEDAVKMGIFQTPETSRWDFGILYEFPLDIRFHPMTGEEIKPNFIYDSNKGFYSLSELQDSIMEKVR
ncbi:MAG: hypothetical protein ABFC98_05965 [Candidatus Cloacimonas sp.]